MSYYKIAEDNGEYTYELPGNVSFRQPALEDSQHTSRPVLYAEETVEALGKLIEIMDTVSRDPDLSEAGRDRKLTGPQAALFEMIANRWTAIDREEADIVSAEAALHAVPVLEATHSAMAIEDREIRDWLRAQPAGTAEHLMVEPGNDRLKIAILRSPIPQADHLVKLARDAWNKSRRDANPAEALRIDTAKTNIEWSRRMLAQVAGLSRVKVRKWDKPRILRQVISSSNPFTVAGFKAFGFGEMDVARAKRDIEFDKATGRAA